MWASDTILLRHIRRFLTLFSEVMMAQQINKFSAKEKCGYGLQRHSVA